MTSIGSFVKQIPLNDGYFRPQPDLAAALSTVSVGAFGTSAVSSYMYSINATTGVFPSAYTPQSLSTQQYLQAGAVLLKDMGTQILSTNTTGNSSPVVFRRVQVVGNFPGGGMATDGVIGAATSTDAAYEVAYILMGFNGAYPAGPFVRTG